MQLSSYDAAKGKLIEEIQTLGATVDNMDERQAKLAELDLLNKKIELVEEANAMSEVFKLQEENLQHRRPRKSRLRRKTSAPRVRRTRTKPRPSRTSMKPSKNRKKC